MKRKVRCGIRRRAWFFLERRCDGVARDRVAKPPAIPLTNCCGCLPVNEIADKGASGNNALEAHNKETSANG